MSSVTYASSNTSSALTGSLTEVAFPSGDSDSFTYDPNTGRPTGYSFAVNSATDAGTLTWNANGTLGNLTIADGLNAADSQSCNYYYDALGRLGGTDSNGYTVDCGTDGSIWGQTFSYDQFGNITKAGNISSFLPTYSTATNQFTVSGESIQYDANGNMLKDNQGNTYTWDKNFGNPASINGVNLIYDALGQMVEQQSGSTYTQMLYSQLGKTAIMNAQTLTKSFVPLPGGETVLYTTSGLTYYRHADWLGSSRLTSTLPPGFNSQGVMTAKVSLDDSRYQKQAGFLKLLDESTAAMRRIPGVASAAVGLTLPYERTLNDGVMLHDGPEAGRQVGTDLVYVTPGYFETLQMPVLAGRTFTQSDGPNAQKVTIVNRSFAMKFFRGMNPVGRMLDKGVVIVGVVADVQISSGLNPVAPLMSEETMYIPAAQVNPQFLALVHVWFQPSWIVRTAGPVEGLTGQMQRALAVATPNLPFSGFYRMSDLQARTLSEQRLEVALLSTMAGLALLLSAVGIFALVASLVGQRTREIGIRIALGSSIRQAMVSVGAPGVRASVLGVVVGLALCAAALRTLRSVLYGVGVYDAGTIVTVVLVLAAVTLIAATAPTLRIARIDPARTLREE